MIDDHAPYSRCDYCWRERATQAYLMETSNGIGYTRYLCDECIRKVEVQKDRIEGRSVCEILESHHRKLKDDPDRLSTGFLKELMGSSARKGRDPEGADQMKVATQLQHVQSSYVIRNHRHFEFQEGIPPYGSEMARTWICPDRKNKQHNKSLFTTTNINTLQVFCFSNIIILSILKNRIARGGVSPSNQNVNSYVIRNYLTHLPYILAPGPGGV